MSTILKNTLFSSISTVMRFLTGSLLFVIMARYFGVQEFGRITFAISLTGIFLVAAEYGFSLYALRIVAQEPDRITEISKGIISGKIILSIVATIAIGMLVYFDSQPFETDMVVLILWASTILYSFGYFFSSIFKGLNKFQYEATSTTILNIILFVLAVTATLSGFGVIAVAIAYLVARAFYLVICIAQFNKHIGKIEFRFDMNFGLKSLRECFPFGIHAIVATLYFQLDTVFIAYFAGGTTEVGLYQAAMRIVFASMMICDIIVSSYSPVIARDMKHNHAGFVRDGITANKYMLLAGGAICSFLLIYSDLVITTLYGAQYQSSILLLRLLSLVVVLRFAGAIYAMVLTFADQQKLRVIAVAVSLLVNILLNICFIPRYGATGAAISSILTHVFLYFIYLLCSKFITKRWFLDVACVRCIGLLVLSGSACWALRDYSLIMSLVLYFATLVGIVYKTLISGCESMFRDAYEKSPIFACLKSEQIHIKKTYSAWPRSLMPGKEEK